MIVLHAAPVVWGKIGGLQSSIPALVAAQNCLDDIDAAMVVTVANTAVPPVDVDFPVFDRKITVDHSGRLNLPAPFDRPDLVVFHSTYIPAHAKIASMLQKADIPYIVCPRGGMTRRSQATKPWKKRLGNLLFFNWIVSNAAGLHYLTEGEVASSVEWKLPRFVVGNGIDVPEESDTTSPGRSTGLRFLFLGRLHIEHKGLDMLLDACAIIGGELYCAGARLDICGPDCLGSTAWLARRISELGLEDVVAVHGPAIGEAKAELLRRADVFVHTSRTEGHPSAVLEAIAHGVPCLLTPNTNMAEQVASAGAGWRVEPAPGAIAQRLLEIVTSDRSVLKTVGFNARRLAAERFNWPLVANQCIRQYRKFAA
jgi:glycosyltransferase involved in cell wall biosynthesis